MFRLVFIAVAVVGCFGYNYTDGDVLKPDGKTKGIPYNLELELKNNKSGKYEHHCDATIINVKVALTAASCTHGQKPANIRFRHGNKARGIGGTEHAAEQIITHERYRAGSYDYNIAVVVVDEPFPFRAIIRRATSAPRAFTKATSTGWGMLLNNPTRPSSKREVTYPVIDHKLCSKKMSSVEAITERILCAGNNLKTDCGGDFGAPLVVDDYLVGIVLSEVCGTEKKNVGIFTNVAVMNRWIDKLIPELKL